MSRLPLPLLSATIALAVALPVRAQDAALPTAPPADPVAPASPEPPPVGKPAVEEMPADTPPELRLKRGKNLFDYGDCKGAATVLAPLSAPGLLTDQKDQLQVHWILGVCNALEGKPTESAREFSSLLAIDPDYSIDPFLTPPAAVEVFDKQKAQMKAQLEEIRRARDEARKARLDAESGLLVERESTVRELPFAAVFLPFGFAQAANGETVKAIVFGSVQASTLAVNVGAYWTVEGTKLSRIDTGEKLTVERIAWYTHIGALMGFAIAYGVGVVDAMWNREDHVVVDKKQTKRALTPEEVKKLRDVRTAPAPAPATP